MMNSWKSILISLSVGLVFVFGIEFQGQAISDAFMEFNLLEMIPVPPENGVEFITGTDGFVAYQFKSGADVKSPHRLILPEKLNEFAIMVTFRPNSRTGGYLFSVVNPLDTVVQLGIHISPADRRDKWNVTLLYTDASVHVTKKLVTFEIDYSKRWQKIAFEVLNNKLKFFYDCVEIETLLVKREPIELVFDSASTLYLAQGGSMLKGHYEGAIEFLKVYGNPEVVPFICNLTQTQSQTFDDLNLYTGSGDEQGLDDFLSDDELFDDASNFINYNYNVTDEDTGLDQYPPPMPPPPDKMLHRISLKGEKGERGPKGPPGDPMRGPPGPPGPPGPKGEAGPYPPYVDVGSSNSGGSGKCGCNATTLLELIKDNESVRESIRGAPGLPGKEGKTGAPGLTGATGVPGERGAPGLKGDRGDRGDPGPRGPEGLQGNKGEPGLDGTPGVPGTPGPPGPPGLPENLDESLMISNAATLGRGGPGPKGDPGDKGVTGRQGERGIAGSKGERGDPGMTGAKGDRGHTGNHGLSGAKGEPGAPGFPGLAGLPGATGNKGDRGFPGEIGPIGPAGPPGSVIYADSKTNITECQCQPGQQGPIGPRGPAGFDGEPGTPGLTGMPGIKGEKGEKAVRGAPGPKGDRGPEGPPGQPFFSADMAVNGTKGDKGEKGMRGRRGKPGTPGPIGPPGKPGPPGEAGTGYSGRPGLPGSKGDMGQKGQKGDSGLKEGTKGDKGDRGMDGRTGQPGPPGLPAASGDGVQYVPLPGPPGPPGPPGTPGISITGPKGEPGMEARSFFGDPAFYGKPGGRSAIDELKAMRELQNLKDLPENSSGPPGPPGPPGVPGSFKTNQQEEPFIAASSMRIVPGAVTFQNTETMTKNSAFSPVGTIAYIIEEEALLVRVNKGWQYIALGSLLPIATPAPPTTIAPTPRTPNLQSSNLLNNVPQPAEGPNFTVSPEYETWYPRMLRIAALNEPYYGDFQGIRGADFACYRQARRAGLLGTFKAFLTSRVQNLDSIVRTGDRELPVVNTRGDVLFNSWKAIFNGHGGFFSQAPRIYSFSGKNVLQDGSWPQKIVWHGSMPNGERAMDTYCDAWHSSSPDKFGLASSLLGNNILDQERYSCDNRFIVLCIEALSQDRRRKRDVDHHRTTNFTTAHEYAKHLQDVLT